MRGGRRQALDCAPPTADKSSMHAGVMELRRWRKAGPPSGLGLALVLGLLCSCRAVAPGRTAPPAGEAAPLSGQPPTRYPAVPHIVAIGDLHGDLAATRAVLRLAHAVDAKDAWAGGSLVVVQTGDVLDRGDDELAILELFERLEREAHDAGGAFISLLGNHEVRNVQGDFKYVTSAGYAVFARAAGSDPQDEAKGRAARESAFRPGGPWARRLARHNVAAVIGSNVFVHGGITPAHAAFGLERINAAVSSWMAGSLASLPALLSGRDSPFWTRQYSEAPAPRDCLSLAEALAALDARRMIVGHTVQEGGIAAACDGQVWRIDTGMGVLHHGLVQVLDIRGDHVLVLGGSRGAEPL
jgi:hypothetical protein